MSSSPEAMSARDGAHAPPSTPMPRSMAMAAPSSAAYTQPRPRASSSQALFRPHTSGAAPAAHTHRSYHNTPDSSPLAGGWSGVGGARRGHHNRANSALGKATTAGGGSFSPSPLLFAPNLAQASPLLLPTRGQSFDHIDGDGALGDSADGGSADHSGSDSESEGEAAAAAFSTPRAFRSPGSPLAQTRSSPGTGTAAFATSRPMLSPANFARAQPPSFQMTPVTGRAAAASDASRSASVTPRTLAYAAAAPTSASASGAGPKIATGGASASASPPFRCGACGASFAAKGSLVRHEATHPALAQARLDAQGSGSDSEIDDADSDANGPDRASRPSAFPSAARAKATTAAHPEPPFALQDVARNASPSASAAAAEAEADFEATFAVFPPFSPSELRPLGSPPAALSGAGGSGAKAGAGDSSAFTFSAPAAAAAAPTPATKFPRFSPSELLSPPARGQALDAGADGDGGSGPFDFGPSGFSPRHAHWSPATEWDERYAVEASDDDGQAPGEASGSPLRRPNASAAPRIQMSPATRSASDQLVPSLSWLLILARKLTLSGAVTEAQGRRIKAEVLAANPRLLSAVERFVHRGDSDAVVDALLACLPEGEGEQRSEQLPQEQRQQQRQQQSQSSAADSDSFDDDDDDYLEDDEEAAGAGESDSDAEYSAILQGRGPGGHKAKAMARPTQMDAQSDSSAAESDDEENALLVVHSLLPLDLPRLSALHGLLHELGFGLIDLETLSLCTSPLLPAAPRELIGGAGPSPSQPPSQSRAAADPPVAAVTPAAWRSCVQSLRLHSRAPRLFTQLMEAVYNALDLNSTSSVPYGELIATVAVFCRAASHRQRLQFIFNALQRNAAPVAGDEPVLAATAAYGFIFSCSLAIRLFVSVASLQLDNGQSQAQALTAAQLQSVSSSVGVHSADVWTLTNSIYALFDRQFGGQHSAAANAAADDDNDLDRDAAAVPDVSYERWLQWKWHPTFVLENLLQQ